MRLLRLCSEITGLKNSRKLKSLQLTWKVKVIISMLIKFKNVSFLITQYSHYSLQYIGENNYVCRSIQTALLVESQVTRRGKPAHLTTNF